MTDSDQCIYTIHSFSADGALPGPSDLSHDEAQAYLAQRMADQHPGGLTAKYWNAEAGRILEKARESPGSATIRPVARGRGVTVRAIAAGGASFEVRIHPLFDDDGPAGELCAAFDHPHLAEALRQAGRRAQSWLRVEAQSWCEADERGDVVGFEAEIFARLNSPFGKEPVSELAAKVGAEGC